MNKSADKLLSQYFLKLPDALLNFQFIEESLRMYIAYCYEIISVRVSKQIPFKYRYKDLEKDALGKLLSKFKRFNSNNELIGKIEKVIKDRNYCAHKAYLLTYEQQNDPDYLKSELEKLENIVNKAKECMHFLSAELKQAEEIKKSLSKSNN